MLLVILSPSLSTCTKILQVKRHAREDNSSLTRVDSYRLELFPFISGSKESGLYMHVYKYVYNPRVYFEFSFM